MPVVLGALAKHSTVLYAGQAEGECRRTPPTDTTAASQNAHVCERVRSPHPSCLPVIFRTRVGAFSHVRQCVSSNTLPVLIVTRTQHTLACSRHGALTHALAALFVDVESVMNSISRLVCLLKQEAREPLVQALCTSLASEAHPGNEAARMRM